MTYRSILVHACQSHNAQARYRLAASIAQAENARLSGIALSGAIEFVYRCGAAGAITPLATEDASFLTEAAQRELAAFEQAARGAGVVAASGSVTDESAGRGLPLAARYCDLLLIGQSIAADAVFADDRSLARTVLIHAPCPVLVVPADSQAEGLPRHPLVAWDGSMEASRAVRAALPLLKRATKATVVCFPPQKYQDDEGAAGTRLAAYLACHGIATDLLEPPHPPSVGKALLALAASGAHDLIVMGSFGHSRFREIVLGGATHTVLTHTTVPVLMHH
jgi:nucleotide-binding universal stress UspA family protein